MHVMEKHFNWDGGLVAELLWVQAGREEQSLLTFDLQWRVSSVVHGSHFFHFRPDYSWNIQSKCQRVILMVTESLSNEQFISTEDFSSSLLYIDGSVENNYNSTHQQKHHQKLMHTDHDSLLHNQVSQSWMAIISCYLLLANSPACCSQQWSRLHSGMAC